jgi:hypothetical protein
MTVPVTYEANRVLASTISVSVASAQSAVLTGADILYWCAVATNVLFGADPTATAAGVYVPANTLVRFTNITRGEKLAALAVAGGNSTAYYVEA